MCDVSEAGSVFRREERVLSVWSLKIPVTCIYPCCFNSTSTRKNKKSIKGLLEKPEGKN
jgi:hypothetical protein